MLLQASNPELKKLLIISIAVMVLLALAIILFVLFYQRRVIRHQQEIKRINDQKQLELTQAALQGEEEEKMRIASELHDDVGATLSTIKRYFTAALNTQNNNNTEIAAEANALLDSSIDKVRNISHTLQPAFLQQLPNLLANQAT
jgi:signal transduction histidine kinase